MKIFLHVHNIFLCIFLFSIIQIFFLLLLSTPSIFDAFLIVCNWHTQRGKQAIDNRLIIHFRIENRMAKTGIM